MEGKVCNNCRFWTSLIDNGVCNISDKYCEIDDTCEKYKPNLSKAWKNFIVSIGESLGLDRFLDWLNDKINNKL